MSNSLMQLSPFLALAMWLGYSWLWINSYIKSFKGHANRLVNFLVSNLAFIFLTVAVGLYGMYRLSSYTGKIGWGTFILGILVSVATLVYGSIISFIGLYVGDSRSWEVVLILMAVVLSLGFLVFYTNVQFG